MEKLILTIKLAKAIGGLFCLGWFLREMWLGNDHIALWALFALIGVSQETRE